MLKHTLLEYRAKGSSESEDEHLDHCVEYLRQVSSHALGISDYDCHS